MNKNFFKVGADGQLELKVNPDKELFVANAMNEIGFKDFTNFELDIFYTLCAVLSNTPEGVYILNLKDLKEALKRQNYSDKQILDTVDRLTDRLTASKEFKNENGETIKGSMFVTATPDNCDYIRVWVSPEHRFLINDIHSNFTKIEMREFINLKLAYSKKLYRIIRQFDDLGIVRIKIEDLKKVLGISENYKPKYINDQIIKPACEELRNIFTDLNYTAKRSSKRGKPITSYVFSWIPRRKIIDEKDQNQKRLEQRKNKAMAILKEQGVEVNTKPKNGKSGSFEGRQYDFDQLEAQLVNNEQVPGQMSLEKDFPEWCPNTTDKDN